MSYVHPADRIERGYLSRGGDPGLVRWYEIVEGGYDTPPHERGVHHVCCGYTVGRYRRDDAGHPWGSGIGERVGRPEDLIAGELARLPLGPGEFVEVVDPWGRVVGTTESGTGE